MIEKLTLFFKNKNNLAVVILMGILFMVIAMPVKKKESGRSAEEVMGQKETQEASPGEDYVREMESRLEETLSGLEGAGEVKVMITLSALGEEIPDKDVSCSLSETGEEDGQGGIRNVKTEERETATVFLSENGSSTPYVVKTLTPEVQGVIVLAQGAGEGNVSMEIMEAVKVIFGIEANRVKVLKLRGTN